jgi:hypothetical protein
MRARFVNSHLVRHKFHVKKLAVDEEILISELRLTLDIRHVTDKDTFISLKALKASLAIDFTTEKIILTRSLDKAIDALIHGQAIAFANIITGRSFHIDVFAFGKIARDESTHGIEIQRMPTRNCGKSEDKTKCRLRTSGCKAIKVITAFLLLVSESNKTCFVTFVLTIAVL